MAMDIYRKVKVVLLEDSKRTSEYNKLVKLQVQAEDAILLQLLTYYLQSLEWYVPSGVALHFRDQESRDRAIQQGRPMNHKDSVSLARHCKDELMVYLNRVISEQKPEWQIIAERHGWGRLS